MTTDADPSYYVKPGTLLALLDPRVFARETGYTLRGYSVSLKDGDFQVIFRASDRKGNPVYCLFVAVELADALQGLFWTITGRDGHRYWYPDKWAK